MFQFLNFFVRIMPTLQIVNECDCRSAWTILNCKIIKLLIVKRRTYVPSPTPMNLIGLPDTALTLKADPPLVSPSIFVKIAPVMPMSSLNLHLGRNMIMINSGFNKASMIELKNTITSI